MELEVPSFFRRALVALALPCSLARDSVAKLAAMNAAVAAFIESRRLKPIEAAKVHAAASMAISDALLTEPSSQFSTAQRRQP